MAIKVLAKPRAWEGRRPRRPRFAATRATRTLPLPGFAGALYTWKPSTLSLLMRLRKDENTVRTDSQLDYNL